MKTAMQELIDYLYENKYFDVLPVAKELLEKEKEQIKEAWYNGGVNGMGLFETNTGEEYYNQNYNQNKLTYE